MIPFLLAQSQPLPAVFDAYIRPVPPRARSVVRIDPVEAEILAGGPSPGADWKPIAFKDNTVEAPPNHYVWFKVGSVVDRTYLLNMSGSTMGYVNGEPRFGDVYGYGSYRVPVALKAGQNNSIVMTTDRSPIRINFGFVEPGLRLDAHDATLPDWREASSKTVDASVLVYNATAEVRQVWIRTEVSRKAPQSPFVLLPFSSTKIPIRVSMKDAEHPVELMVGNEKVHELLLKSATPKTDQSYRETFKSHIDGSVQYYAVNPAAKGPGQPIVLSLHGASVEAIGQAQAYGQKPDFNIVCPTNRRPYGFNWEDIGRLDAFEALADARTKGLGGRHPVQLTGHSMGGHGTWHLGVHYPGMFEAIAPCAGWISYDTYAGGANYNVADPVQAVLQRANLPSRTLTFKENLAAYKGVYIHHGEADETVPIAEARTMYGEIKTLVPTTLWEEKGAGHWFDNDPAPGADSVDWKPIFDLFRQPSPAPTRKWAQVVADPWIGSRTGPIVIEGQESPRQAARVEVVRTARSTIIQTGNVAALRVDWGQVDTNSVTLDGLEFPRQGKSKFEKTASGWKVVDRWTRAPRNTEMGFKGAMHAGYKLVIGNGPDSPEKQWAIRFARYLQETSWYRANGSPEVVFSNRPVRGGIYLGSPSGNEALRQELKRQKSIQWTAKGLRIGDREYQSPMSVIVRFPFAGGWIGGTDAESMKATERFPFFVAGAALPDVLLARPSYPAQGTSAVLCAGFFGFDGSIERGVWAP